MTFDQGRSTTAASLIYIFDDGVPLMIRTMVLRRPLVAGVLLGAMLLFVPAATQAYTISLTGGTLGGIPGGQPL